MKNDFLYHSLSFIISSSLCLSSFATAADPNVIANGKHEYDPTSGKKIAVYSYKIDNLTQDGIAIFAVGDEGTGKPPSLDATKMGALPTKFVAPKGWVGHTLGLAESNNYLIEWIVAEEKDLVAGNYYLLPGQSSDQFIVQAKKTDSNYVSAKAMVQDISVNMIKADTEAPTAEIYLTTLPAVGKRGWLEVSVTAAAHDNMDPYPDVLLSKITANQTFPATDVQAVFNEETKKFLVKMAKDRIYNVTFTVMDASGNTTTYTKELPAK
ncbi:hypothetical protein ACO0K7_15405 [Undibacterium sp. Ji67W]|uniref:hypothetical protein n=1 Tax=Undibacterium sp. Ji67W TaxID=3413042 RepID=UPI003BF30D9A